MNENPHLNRAALRRRIRRFYDLLNRHDFSQCYVMIDPRIRDKPGAVTIAQYKQSLSRYVERAGSITVEEVRISALHQDEPNRLYENRDFALGTTVWVDMDGNRHESAERWVFEGGDWYTRSTGLIWVEPSDNHEAVPARN